MKMLYNHIQIVIKIKTSLNFWFTIIRIRIMELSCTFATKRGK